MKKFIALILAALMMPTVVACNNTNNDDAKDSSDAISTDVPTTEATSDAPAEEPAKAPVDMFNATLDKFYETIAPAFGMTVEEVKAANYFAGGYAGSTEGTMVEGKAGRVPAEGEEALAALAVMGYMSEEAIQKIDDAAMFFHMNISTLTMTTVHVANSADVDTVAGALKDGIANNHFWSCGFPDKYIVIKVGDYVFSGYGKNDPINAVKTAITATYADAVVLFEDAVA